jgi:hypothetical protein
MIKAAGRYIYHLPLRIKRQVVTVGRRERNIYELHNLHSTANISVKIKYI